MSQRQDRVYLVSAALIVVAVLVAVSLMWTKGSKVSPSDFVVASDFNENPLDLNRTNAPAELAARSKAKPSAKPAPNDAPRNDAHAWSTGVRKSQPVPDSDSAVAESGTQSAEPRSESGALNNELGWGNPLSGIAPAGGSSPGSVGGARAAGRASTAAGSGAGGLGGSSAQKPASQDPSDVSSTETARASGTRAGVQSLTSGLPNDVTGAPPPAPREVPGIDWSGPATPGVGESTVPADEVFPTLLRLLDETPAEGAPGGTPETPGEAPTGTLAVAPPKPLVVNPEPGTLLLLGTGLFAAGRRLRRR